MSTDDKELIIRGAESADLQAILKIQMNAFKVYTNLIAAEQIKFYSGLGYSGEAVLKNHYGNFDWIVFSKFFESKADV